MPQQVADMAEKPDFIAGVWAAIPTPFQADGRLDETGLRANCAYFANALQLRGVFCNGVMGEVGALTRRERMLALEANLLAAGTMHVGVVINDQSLAETLELARHAGSAGAHHVVLMRPPGQLSDTELQDYCSAAIEAAGVPGVLFDRALPGAGWPRAVIAALASQGLIRAVKCTRDWDSNVELRQVFAGALVVTDPFEFRLLANLARFDLKVLYADPEPYLFQSTTALPIRDCMAAAARNDWAEAVRLFRALEPLRAAYDRWVLRPLRHGGPMNAALKHWCSRIGLAAGPVRAPLRPLTDEDRRQFDTELDQAMRSVEHLVRWR